MVNYDAELLSLKTEIHSLQTIITDAMEQISKAIASIPVPSVPPSIAMETDSEHSTNTTTLHQTTIDLPALIHELKHDIATIIVKTQAMFQQQTTQKLITNPRHLPTTWIPIWTSVGLLRPF